MEKRNDEKQEPVFEKLTPEVQVDDYVLNKIGAQIQHFDHLISKNIERQRFFSSAKAGEIHKNVADYEESNVIKQVADCYFL